MLPERPVAFGSEQEQLIDDIYMSGYAMRTVIEVGSGDGLDPDAIATLVERIVRSGIATSLDFVEPPETGIPTPDELDKRFGLLDALYDRVYKSESYTTQDLAFLQDLPAGVLGDAPWRRIAVSPLERAGMPPDQRREQITLGDYLGLEPEWTRKPPGCEMDRCVHQLMCERRLPAVYYDLLRSGREDLAKRIVRRNCHLVSKYGDEVVGGIFEQCREHTELSPPLMLVIGDDASVEYVPMPEKHRDQIEDQEAPTKEGPGI